MQLAPIILFVYNRPWHAEQTLNALMQNDFANQSTLYIYADGIRTEASNALKTQVTETREIIRKKQWCKEVIIVEKTENDGLAKSIINGVSEIINKHGKVIVLEDDIVTSQGFLKYMNDALSIYETNEKVFHISGYMYPHNRILPETFFLNVPLCWGWATWKDSWSQLISDNLKLIELCDADNNWIDFDKFGGNYLSNQLKANIAGDLNTWFVKWHASVLLKKGYCLFPNISLVNNIGFDGTGVHNGPETKFTNNTLADYIEVKEIEIKEHSTALEIVQAFYFPVLSINWVKKSFKSTPFIYSWSKKVLDRLFRFVYPGIHQNLVWNKIDRIETQSYIGTKAKIYGVYKIDDVILGNYSYISENAVMSKVRVGKFCSIGPNILAGWGIHPTNGISTSPMFYSNQKQNGLSFTSNTKIQERKYINIGNDVFIGMNVTILDGVTIGHGAIIGAGALVSKNIPPYAIAIGNPIKISRFRFSEQQINDLLKINWWDFDELSLKGINKYFFDIDEFIKKYGKD